MNLNEVFIQQSILGFAGTDQISQLF